MPYVQSELTGRFRFDSFDNPKLKELRERYQLDAIVAPGQDEFERQVLLLDWVHHRFKKFGRPSSEAKGALEILQAIDEGHTFFCSHYAHVFVSAAASLGWIDRELALRRHHDLPQGGSTEHSPTEIWSNQYRKWVMMDPTAHLGELIRNLGMGAGASIKPIGVRCGLGDRLTAFAAQSTGRMLDLSDSGAGVRDSGS